MDKPELLVKPVGDGQFPKKVYKYRSFDDYPESIFCNDHLWFASIQSFNDPFDGQISDAGQYTTEDIESYLRSQGVSSRDIAKALRRTAEAPNLIVEIVESAK